MVTLGLLGCGAQELPGGSRDAGRDLSRPVIDATGRNFDGAGCPPEGKIACSPYGCPGSQVVATPECINGVWSCPGSLIDLSCPVDAGTSADARPPARDAAVSCSRPTTNDVHRCVNWCYSDVGDAPICVNGSWTCLPGDVDVRTCPPCSTQGIVPPGCVCSGAALSCPADAGPTAARDASAGCPPLFVDGGQLSCGCGSDTSPQPTCAGGAWTCPPLSTPATICPATPPKCHGAQPAGCFCNPITGVLSCARDAGADAPS